MLLDLFCERRQFWLDVFVFRGWTIGQLNQFLLDSAALLEYFSQNAHLKRGKQRKGFILRLRGFDRGHRHCAYCPYLLYWPLFDHIFG
jgi:hypothetical protein